ncbi:glycoside hydrolase family 71 protein [Irpex lacteus]|nr:glycoside hydrolase family 71 protein [Irpex lacteus]
MVSKADATINAAASNQTLTPVGKYPSTQQPPLAVNKLVFAHFIVGNTYNYTVDSWKAASSKGIDAFALNVGSDPWEPSQVANAFAAATALKTPFKLFMSFDMTSLSCNSAPDADLLKAYISSYRNHANQQKINGKVLLSTFAGSDCCFGQDTVDDGWTFAIKSGANVGGTYFIPAWFIDPLTFPQYKVLDGAFAWNSGWPLTDSDIDFHQDKDYLDGLPGRSYMAASSPWFYTHYNTKNFIWRPDDWLLANRWEAIVANRTSIDFVEVNTWNDYGESHYIGPIEAWVDGYDHTPWLDLYKYYIAAYKTGTYPHITTDRTFVWGRTYPVDVVATADTLPKPDHYTWTDDYIWAVMLLKTPATLSSTTSAPAGVAKLKVGPLTQDCTVSTTITRGKIIFKYTTAAPAIYNYNAYVVST